MSQIGTYPFECPNLEENVNNAKFDDEEELLLMAQEIVET